MYVCMFVCVQMHVCMYNIYIAAHLKAILGGSLSRILKVSALKQYKIILKFFKP